MKDHKDSLEVIAAPDERPEGVIKKFMRRFRNSGLMQELMDRRSYMKPSVKRRRKASKAAARRRSERIS